MRATKSRLPSMSFRVITLAPSTVVVSPLVVLLACDVVAKNFETLENPSN